MINRNTHSLNSERLELQTELGELEAEMAGYLEELGYGA
jgi:type I restriction enzyme M protein